MLYFSHAACRRAEPAVPINCCPAVSDLQHFRLPDVQSAVGLIHFFGFRAESLKGEANSAALLLAAVPDPNEAGPIVGLGVAILGGFNLTVTWEGAGTRRPCAGRIGFARYQPAAEGRLHESHYFASAAIGA